jgi:hypothetical protein
MSNNRILIPGSILIILLILSHINIKAQQTAQEPIENSSDSVFLNSVVIRDFRFDSYYYPSPKFDPEGYAYFVYSDNKLLLKSPVCLFPNIYPCTEGDCPCTFPDINGDGFREMIFVCGSGGSAGADDAYIYSLRKYPKEIAAFTGYDKGQFVLSDCERDGYPEPTFGDLNFLCWHYGCSGSPRPDLVWKWNGKKYRLANFKLGYLYLKNELNIDIKHLAWNSFINSDLKVGKYDPNDEYGYPVELLRSMLNFIYFGYSNYADTLFNRAWPDSVANKKLFYDDLWNQIKSDPYWPELQKSNW